MESSPRAGGFARSAATLSLLSPLVAIFLYVFLFAHLQSHGETRFTTIAVIGLLPLLLILAGLVLGVVALAQTKRHGRQGIFGKAVSGICINGLFLLSLVIGPILLPLVLLGKNFPMTAQGRLNKALATLVTASDGQSRFYALNDAAKESFAVGQIEDARKYATELLALAPKFQSNWNHGNAIQDGNLVLGRIAVREGQMEIAKHYLLAAGKSSGSPQMNSFGPNMSLAKDLLEKGERDVVLQYFDLSRNFWKMDYGKLNDWSQYVKAGKIPDFGANLLY